MPSFETLGSSLNSGSATTHACRSVKRKVSGSTSGCSSMRASAMSSASFQVMVFSVISESPLFWNFNNDVAAHHGLAAQARVQCEALGRVKAVLLVLLHR